MCKPTPVNVMDAANGEKFHLIARPAQTLNSGGAGENRKICEFPPSRAARMNQCSFRFERVYLFVYIEWLMKGGMFSDMKHYIASKYLMRRAALLTKEGSSAARIYNENTARIKTITDPELASGQLWRVRSREFIARDTPSSPDQYYTHYAEYYPENRRATHNQCPRSGCFLGYKIAFFALIYAVCLMCLRKAVNKAYPL
ncbi:hypothetical protein [Cypionkella sp. TWP1-2-1b2]|uniref:hypothetical protein n=1 Tax=Cypionkella sp. TWP1-2-1b2 TaxID=2804675 RepID=UPI003CEF776D